MRIPTEITVSNQRVWLRWTQNGRSLKQLVKMYDEYGYTQLHNAVARGSFNEVVRLLEADISSLEVVTLLTDLRPLHVAALENNLATIQLLVHKGAQVNARCRLGRTPLMLLMSSSKIKGGAAHQAIRTLINAGADFNLVCKDGMLALEYGCSSKRRRILVQYMTIAERYRQAIISKRNLELIEAVPRLRERLEKCRVELEIIERTEISGHIYLENLVMKSPRELAPFTYNPEVVEFFEKHDLEKKFKLFGRSMRKNWDLAKEEAQRRWS